uniref:Ionotropic glutamate receptor C-terminal domain-containing protein n=1 Tax=Daphnia galeata TaxID=27404 RepID=A0A8J2WGK7_9CRUS|nr:unnamed protein product [Daphnia galeata]
MFFIRGLFVAKIFVVVFTAELSNNQDMVKANSIAGEHIRILAYHEPPIFNILRDPVNQSSVRYVGFPKNVLDVLSTSWNFTYSFVEVTPSMMKSKGSVDAAMIEQLLLKNADINGRLSSPTAELLVHIDFIVAVSPMPQIQNRFSDPIKPFQPPVWYLIFVAFGATALLLGVIKKVSISNGRIQVRSNTRIVFENPWYPWMVLMTQGDNLPSSRLPLRFVAGSWCLMAVVLVYAYNSTLISYISLAKYELDLNTFDDLAASKTLLNYPSKTGALKTLGDSLRQNPQDLLLSLPGETEKVLLSGCCAYVEIDTILIIFFFDCRSLGELLVYKSMVEHGGECKLTFGKELDYSQVWSFGVAKNFAHLSKINHGLQMMRQTGLFSKISKQYLKPVDKCLEREAYRPKKSQLTLYDMTGSFIVLLLGSSLSLLAFLFKLLVSPRFFRTTTSLPTDSLVVVLTSCLSGEV